MRARIFVFFCCFAVSSAMAADWTQWRGAHRDGVSPEAGLLKEWPQGGPPLRWKATDLGTGYSSPAIVAGRIYLQTTREDREFVLALDEKSGQQLWSVPIGTVGTNRGPQYPGTRSTPTVDGQFVYCLASAGELTCVHAVSGQEQWQKHLRNDFAGKVGNWAYSESVLVDGNLLICTPGGSEATVAALDKMSGETVWVAAVPGGDQAEYASVVPMGEGNAKQYVQFLGKGVTGFDAATGRLAWRYEATASLANILTPIVSGNRVFSAGSRTGGALVELASDGPELVAKEIYRNAKLGASIGGAILVDGNLFGTTRNAMFCADFSTGKLHWAERALGASSVCYADGRIYARAHRGGAVALVEASEQGYRERGRFTQPNQSGIAAWPHPVIANRGLYLRDQGTLLCYHLAAAGRGD